jgi:hypothetical protein
MPSHTDSAIIEYNEDGSRTVTTVETIYPLTTKEKATAYSLLGGLLLAPFVPVIAIALSEKMAERRAARKADLKVVKNDD